MLGCGERSVLQCQPDSRRVSLARQRGHARHERVDALLQVQVDADQHPAQVFRELDRILDALASGLGKRGTIPGSMHGQCHSPFPGLGTDFPAYRRLEIGEVPAGLLPLVRKPLERSKPVVTGESERIEGIFGGKGGLEAHPQRHAPIPTCGRVCTMKRSPSA